MKKIFCATLTILVLMFAVNAFATTGPAQWALNDNQYLTGIDNENGIATFGIMNPNRPYVYGFVEDGITYERGMQTTFIFPQYICGTTTLNTTVTIDPEYEDMVNNLVRTYCGYDSDVVLEAKDYIKATTIEKTIRQVPRIGHRFFNKSVDVIPVGQVVINQGTSVLRLYLGDFDHDGAYELGFAAGSV